MVKKTYNTDTWSVHPGLEHPAVRFRGKKAFHNVWVAHPAVRFRGKKAFPHSKELEMKG